MSIDPSQKEFSDSAAEIARKVDVLTAELRKARYACVYTGAGISTSASIPDFRGDNGLNNKPVPMVVLGLKEQDLDFVMPTYSHMAVAKLVEAGIVKFVATSNHDGLHQKSGLRHEQVADIFGNAYVEQCLKCHTHYLRRVIVPTSMLGRTCDRKECGGRLHKTGTPMGGQTPAEPLARASEHAHRSDFSLVLGSSMTISPFCTLPHLAARTVLVTMQNTAYDSQSVECIHARCDEVMRAVMAKLGLAVDPLVYRIPFGASVFHQHEEWHITVHGDTTRPHEPLTCVKDATAHYRLSSGQEASTVLNVRKDGAFVASVRGGPQAITHVWFEIEWQPLLKEDDMVTQQFEVVAGQPCSWPLEFVKTVAYTHQSNSE